MTPSATSKEIVLDDENNAADIEDGDRVDEEDEDEDDEEAPNLNGFTKQMTRIDQHPIEVSHKKLTSH